MENAIILHEAPGLDLSAIDRAANLQPTTKYKYKREVQALVQAGINLDDHTALKEYADGLKSSRKSFLKAGLRLVTLDFEQDVKANATPQNIKSAQAMIFRLEAMRGAVVVEQHKGTKAHIWLSQKQVKKLTALCNRDTLEGRRDWIVLALLLGAGLRREELASLTWGALKQQPTKRGRMRDVLQVKGKGAKVRVIPISARLGKRLRDWHSEADGRNIARRMEKKSKVKLGKSMSAIGIFNLVRKYGALIDVPELAAHDLRRTFAELGYRAGIPITQISVLLGHADLTTTQRYLDLKIDLETTASDFIVFG
jgi:integrase